MEELCSVCMLFFFDFISLHVGCQELSWATAAVYIYWKSDDLLMGSLLCSNQRALVSCHYVIVLIRAPNLQALTLTKLIVLTLNVSRKETKLLLNYSK